MVHYVSGTLLECDPSIVQFLLKLNNDADPKFILDKLDDTHLIVVDGTADMIRREVERHLELQIERVRRDARD